jgi:hypothetical protein
MYVSRGIAIGLSVLVVAVAVFFGARAIFDDDGGGTIEDSGDEGFQLEYPDPWTPISDDELAQFPGAPLVVLEREDDSGLFVVRREEKSAPTEESFGKELEKELSDRVPDYEPGTVRTVTTQSGEAFYFSYARSEAGTANSIVVVPDGSASFVLESASAADDRKAAEEIAGMIASFGV